MPIDPDAIEIQHNPARARFELQVGEYLAELDYTLKGQQIIFTHTGVPSALEGRGIGSRLVRAGLDFARQNGYRVGSYCSFVDVYIARHPEYQALLKG